MRATSARRAPRRRLPGRTARARIERRSARRPSRSSRCRRRALSTSTEPGAIAVRSPTSTTVREPLLSVALARPDCVATLAKRTESALPCSDPTVRASVAASVRADAASLWYRLPAVAAMPPARASAFPCWLSLIRLNTSTPIATIGTTTITTKKMVRRARKLIAKPGRC